MDRLGCALLSAMMICCSRGASLESAPQIEQGASQNASTGGHSTGPSPEKEDTIEPTLEQVESIINRTYPERIPHTKKQLEVVSFVEKYLETEGRSIPSLRKYLIDTPSEGHWIVTLLDLRLLQKGGRGGDLSVYVDESKGQLKVSKVIVGT